MKNLGAKSQIKTWKNKDAPADSQPFPQKSAAHKYKIPHALSFQPYINMAETKFVIGRPINGITINGREFVCDEKNEPMLFDSEDLALAFLKENGIDDPEAEGIEILPE